MTLRSGWFEKNDWGVVYQVIGPQDEFQGTRPLRGRELPAEGRTPSDMDQELQDLFRGGLVLVTGQPLAQGENLLLYFHPPGRPDTLVVGVENLHTAPLLRPGHYRSSLRVFSIQEAPLDGIPKAH